MPVALLALAASAFGIGTTEFVIVGLLPQVSSDLNVSIPTAGLLISGYALSVVVGAPVLTIAGARLSRKTMLMGLFAAGSLICALAGSYPLLLAGRVVAALCHGAFFGIGSVVAADLVPRHRRASAVAATFTGLTVANVLGVSLGTTIGQHFGWRATFWLVAALGVLAWPRSPPRGRPSLGRRRAGRTSLTGSRPRGPRPWRRSARAPRRSSARLSSVPPWTTRPLPGSGYGDPGMDRYRIQEAVCACQPTNTETASADSTTS
jgi:predicted MFS family arabinose efflux permease